MIHVTLLAPTDRVKTAVVQALAEGGDTVERKDDENLTDDYQKEISGPWDWLLCWRFGIGQSRMEAMMTPASEQERQASIERTV